MFGASLLLSKGPSVGVMEHTRTDLDVAVTSDGGEFLVLYTDVSNHLAVTAIPAQVKNKNFTLYLVLWFMLNNV